MSVFQQVVDVSGTAAFPATPQVEIPFEPKSIVIVNNDPTPGDDVFLSFDGVEDHAQVFGADGVTFVHDSTIQRTASATGEDDETQVIVPAYVIGDIIVAMQNIVGGNGVKDRDGKALRWMDLNVDARAWAKQAA